MLSLTSILQRGISNTLLLLRVRKQHPGCLINSVRVAPDAKLAENVRLAHDVEIRSNTSIGRWTYIEPYTFVSGGGVEIGSFCAIGRNAVIGCFAHPYTYPAVSAKLYRSLLRLDYDDSPRPVRLGNDVWVGEKAIILQGNVGDGAVIGAGAVVTKDVPPCAIVAGVPARIIAWRFDEASIAEYLRIRWWEWSDSKIKQNTDLFAARGDWLTALSGLK